MAELDMVAVGVCVVGVKAGKDVTKTSASKAPTVKEFGPGATFTAPDQKTFDTLKKAGAAKPVAVAAADAEAAAAAEAAQAKQTAEDVAAAKAAEEAAAAEAADAEVKAAEEAAAAEAAAAEGGDSGEEDIV